jgi:hypothetical protein
LDCIARHEDCLFPLIEEASQDRHGTLLKSGGHECQDNNTCREYVETANRLANHLGVPQTPSDNWAVADVDMSKTQFKLLENR